MNSPITGRPMVLKIEKVTHEFRKESFEILYHFYECTDTGEKFEDEALVQLNLQQVYNQYRTRHQLPFPEEIRALRERYDLSAAKMAAVLGLGTNVYRHYEQGEIPNSSNARLIQLAQEPHEFNRLVALSNVLSAREAERVSEKVEAQRKKKESGEVDVQSFLMKRCPPDELTGYRLPSLSRLAEMVVFFTGELKPFKTKLNKLLFYADFSHFRKTGSSISGSRYRAIDMGPVPYNFNSVFEHLADTCQVDVFYTEFSNGSVGEQFVPHEGRAFNSALFQEDELQTLQAVVTRFGNMTTQGIIEASHKEPAWINNFQAGRKLINYLEAFTLSTDAVEGK